MKNERGVTLIELLIVIVIMAGVSTGAFLLVDYATNMERTVAEENALQREARFVMETISNTVRDGGAIEETAAGNIVLKNKNGQEQMVYEQAAGIIRHGRNNRILSDNVEVFTVTAETSTADKVTYAVRLQLKSRHARYEVATKVFQAAQERVGY